MDIKLDATGDVDFSQYVLGSYQVEAGTVIGYGNGYGFSYGEAPMSYTTQQTRIVSSGLTQTTSENLAQRLQIRLLTYKGEWFLDSTIGIDYFGRVFGKGKSKASIDAIFQAEILKEREVLQLTKYESVINQTERSIDISFEVRTIDGFYANVELTV